MPAADDTFHVEPHDRLAAAAAPFVEQEVRRGETLTAVRGRRDARYGDQVYLVFSIPAALWRPRQRWHYCDPVEWLRQHEVLKSLSERVSQL